MHLLLKLLVYIYHTEVSLFIYSNGLMPCVLAHILPCLGEKKKNFIKIFDNKLHVFKYTVFSHIHTLWNHYQNQYDEHLSPSKVSLFPFVIPPICLLSPSNHWSAFCLYRLVCIFFRVLNKWNYTLCTLFWSGLFHST